MFSCLGGGVHLVTSRSDLLAGIGGVAVAVGMLILSLPTRYQLTQDKLLVRSGLFHWKIPLKSIESAAYSSNLLSAPAWSLKRIRVDFIRKSGRRGFVLISPKDRASFLKDLAESWPDLELSYGHSVQRKTKPAGSESDA